PTAALSTLSLHDALPICVIAGLVSSIVQIFPTGDLHGRYVARNQPATTAAMEGLFKSEAGAPVILIGQPDPEHGTIENPLAVNEDRKSTRLNSSHRTISY